MTLLQEAASVFGYSAVSSFGRRFGSDNYRWVKENLLIIAVTLLLIVPGISGYNMSKGHPQRGFWKTLFGTLFGNVLLSLLPIIAAGLLVPGTVPMVALASVGIFVLGLLIGMFRRRKRYEAYAIVAHNADFLDEIGLRETGLDEVTHYAADGTAMRLLEVSKQYAAFMIVGKRGRRAYIKFDASGRMVEYTGSGAIGQLIRRSETSIAEEAEIEPGIGELDFDGLDENQISALEQAVKRAKARKRKRS